MGYTCEWGTMLNGTTVQSTTEAEYIAACSVSKECFYLKQLLNEIGYDVNITIYCDSTSAIAMIRNPVQRQKCKSFFVVYHAVREYHQLGLLRY